jgi:hypothetical protein
MQHENALVCEELLKAAAFTALHEHVSQVRKRRDGCAARTNAAIVRVRHNCDLTGIWKQFFTNASVDLDPIRRRLRTRRRSDH